MGGELESLSRVFRMPREFAGSEVRETVSLLRPLVEKCSSGIVLDFSKTEMVDSSGIGNLVSISQEMKSRKTRLVLSGLKQNLLSIFIDTGIDVFFDIESLGRIKPADAVFFDNDGDIRLNIANEIDGDVSVLHLSGVMNYPDDSNFFKKTMLLTMAESKKVLVDFQNLSFFDSLSVGTILRLSKLLGETGGVMRVCGLNYVVKDMFLTLNLNSIIPIFDNREDAFVDWKSDG